MTTIHRHYNFYWYPTKDAKYDKPIIRTNTITLSKPTGLTEIDAKSALQIFLTNFGSLKKNTIVKIQEFDNLGQIGEDITPSIEQNAIVPAIAV